MPHHPHPPPLDCRVDARRPIGGELLAATSRVPPDLATRFCHAWFDAVERAVADRRVLLFDEMVIGPADPLLLEAAYRVGLIRRAEQHGEFDHEEDDFYDAHPDDDAIWEPPTIADRVLAATGAGEHMSLLRDGRCVADAIWLEFRPDRDQVVPLIRMGLCLERFVLELADAIRIGDAAVVDTREWFERSEPFRWAA